jgi:hypothetical protein
MTKLLDMLKFKGGRQAQEAVEQSSFNITPLSLLSLTPCISSLLEPHLNIPF